MELPGTALQEHDRVHPARDNSRRESPCEPQGRQDLTRSAARAPSRECVRADARAFWRIPPGPSLGGGEEEFVRRLRLARLEGLALCALVRMPIFDGVPLLKYEDRRI